MLARRRRKECSRFSTQLCNSTVLGVRSAPPGAESEGRKIKSHTPAGGFSPQCFQRREALRGVSFITPPTFPLEAGRHSHFLLRYCMNRFDLP